MPAGFFCVGYRSVAEILHGIAGRVSMLSWRSVGSSSASLAFAIQENVAGRRFTIRKLSAKLVFLQAILGEKYAEEFSLRIFCQRITSLRKPGRASARNENAFPGPHRF